MTEQQPEQRTFAEAQEEWNEQADKLQAQQTDYAERITALETQLANAQRAAARAPFLLVPANGGGPGNDNHQPSWSQAEQEIAQRGEWLDTWTGDKPA